MNLYHLRYFITLAEVQHYTKAAQMLLITQPSLSHAIAKLEEELNIKLFEKVGRNVVLTKCGQEFYIDAKNSIEMLDTGIEKARLTGIGGGKIDFAFLRTLGTNMVPMFVHKFLDTCKDAHIQFHFHTGMTADLVQGLRDRKYDMALCSRMPKERDITFIPVARQELVLITPKNHPLAGKKEIDLRETVEYPQIVFSKKTSLRLVIDRLFTKIGKQPQIAYELEDDPVIAGFVENKLGIAVIPNTPSLNDLELSVIKIVYPDWERIYDIAILKGSELTPAAAKFRDYIIAHALI